MFKRLGEDSRVSAFERPGDQISTSTQLQSLRLKAYEKKNRVIEKG